MSEAELQQITVTEDGGFFTVRMPPEVFMGFFNSLLGEGITILVDANKTPKRRRGRPSKEDSRKEDGDEYGG